MFELPVSHERWRHTSELTAGSGLELTLPVALVLFPLSLMPAARTLGTAPWIGVRTFC